MYKDYVSWFMEQDFYREWLADFPEPLNNPAFASALALIVVCMGMMTIINYIRSYLFHSSIKKKNRQLESLRMEQQIKEAQKAQILSTQSDMISQYMNFMMMVQMQNMTSLKSLTFEQWQLQSKKYHNVAFVGTPIRMVAKETPKTERKKKKWVQEEKRGSSMECTIQESHSEGIEETLVEDLSEEFSVDVLFCEEIVDNRIDDLSEQWMDVSKQRNFSVEKEDLQELKEKVKLETEPELDLIPKELTEEQVSDFEKLVAMMDASYKQQEKLRDYKEKKSVVVKNNMQKLNSQLESGLEQLDKQCNPLVHAEDKWNQKKAQAFAKLEADKNQPKRHKKKQK